MTQLQRVWLAIKAREQCSVVRLSQDLRYPIRPLRCILRTLKARGCIRPVQWGVYEAIGDAPPRPRYPTLILLNCVQSTETCP